jgi:hypothetical protein
MPYKKSPIKKSSCIKMYDEKGKPSGLMMEGSAMHMDHESPAKQIDEREGERDEFGTPIPKDFTNDSPQVNVGRILSDMNTAVRTTYHPQRSEELKAKQRAAKKRLKDSPYSESEKQMYNENLESSGYVWKHN